MRIVIKIGSSVLVENDGKISNDRLEKIVNQISNIEKNNDVVLVSSGAIAVGASVLDVERQPNIQRKQVLSAVGQPYLIAHYQLLFKNNDINSAQVLLSRDDLSNRRRYLNAKNAVLNLIKMKVVPVINENDTVVVDELCFGDNDNLSSLVSSLIEADLLILLTDVDGIYDKDPKTYQDAKIIREIADINRININISNYTSRCGTGGMQSKVKAIKKASESGVISVVADGRRDDIITMIVSGDKIGTTIYPSRTHLQAKKHWLLYGSVSQGKLYLDNGAIKAIKSGGSLLPAGVIKADGRFNRGDIVDILNEDLMIGKGIINYSYDDTINIIRKRSSEIAKILGFSYGDALVRRENIVFYS